MSTRFFRARFSDGSHTMAHDTDVPMPLFEELADADRLTDDWVIEMLDYKGVVLVPDVALRDVYLQMTADRLFALIARA